MPHQSPYDMIQKAGKRASASDRWAAIKTNTTERYPVPPASSPDKEESVHAARQAPPQPPKQQQAPPQSSFPPQPPFPPPQPRHAALDDIAQRHIQAVRTASAPQPWEMQPAGERPSPPPKQAAKKEEPSRPQPSGEA